MHRTQDRNKLGSNNQQLSVSRSTAAPVREIMLEMQEQVVGILVTLNAVASNIPGLDIIAKAIEQAVEAYLQKGRNKRQLKLLLDLVIDAHRARTLRPASRCA